MSDSLRSQDSNGPDDGQGNLLPSRMQYTSDPYSDMKVDICMDEIRQRYQEALLTGQSASLPIFLDLCTAMYQG